MLKEPVQKPQNAHERLIAEFARHEGVALNGRNAVLKNTRRSAIESFGRQGIPGKKNEAWKYTSAAALFNRPFTLHLEKDVDSVSVDDVSPFLIPGLDAHVVVTVNGRFSASLSQIGTLPDGTVITSFAKAAEQYVDAIETHYAKYADVDSEALVALNTAFAQDGVFISVPAGTVLEKPVHILNVVTVQEDALIHPRNLYIFGRNSQARVIESFRALEGARTFSNSVSEVFVDADAVIELYKIQRENDACDTVGSTHVYQQEKSNFSVMTVTLGGNTVRNNLVIVPDAEHCETHLFGLYLGKGSQHIDNHTLVDHAKPNCFSNELYKGVLDDRSTGVFNGKVFVRRDAQKTNAFQENKSIVLTDDANMYAKPELEIYADDVKCSHGATTGSVEPEALFYLRSRGIGEREARTMLLYAFAKDVIENVTIEPLRDMLDELIGERFNQVGGS